MSALQKYITAYRNKITNKLFGVVHVKHAGKKKGDALLSFVTGPFTMAPGEFYTDPHSNNWTAPEMARLLSLRGYDVDVINWNDRNFIPRKNYAVCIDMQYNLERLSRYLPKNCVKVMWLVASYPQFQNEAEQKRLNDLKNRRSIAMPAHRTDPATSDPKCADFVIGYGNETVHGTFPMPAGKKIIPIPGPTMEEYDFPEDKDFSLARKNFLWFGGGGAILKGLDLVIEAFARLPHLKLTIIGPASYEKEFEEAYKKELALPNVVRYEKPRKEGENAPSKIDGKYVYDVVKECGAVFGMSASEGGGAATVQAMQAGVFPIVTPNTGLITGAPCIVMENPTVEKIMKTAEDFSNASPEELKKRSREVWKFARANYAKKSFTKAVENFIDNIAKLP